MTVASASAAVTAMSGAAGAGPSVHAEVEVFPPICILTFGSS